MFSICKNYIKVNDDLYQVVKQIPEDRIDNPETEVNAIKNRLRADTAFKKDGMLYFCIKIEDLEIIN